MPKILILSVSAGNGHTRAAEALRARLALDYPQCQVRHLDLMNMVPRPFKFVYKDCYNFLVRHLPPLWQYMYTSTDTDEKSSWLDKIRRAVESFACRSLRKFMREYEPDAIVTSHFMPPQVLKRWMDKGMVGRIPTWVVLTDFDAHRYWLDPGLRGYFTCTEENIFRLKSRGLANEQLELTGIPVMPGFACEIDRPKALERFGLDPGKKIILLMPGGKGGEGLQELAAKILELSPEIQLAVVAGRDQKLYQSLSALAAHYEGRLRPLPFVEEMPELMAACDLVVSKPGGLTTSECLAMGKPMIAFCPIPGQEEANTAYLLEQGAAFKAVDSSGLLFKIGKLLNDWNRVEEMGGRARALGHPLAAQKIVKIIMDDLGVERG